eukprot:scpid100473/ scgid34421/ 
MHCPIALLLSGLCVIVLGEQTCSRRQCVINGNYQERTNSINTVGVLYYSVIRKTHSRWREVTNGQTVSATFKPTSSCNMVVRYVNFYIKGGSSCQTDIQIIRGGKMKTRRHITHCGRTKQSCLRWHGLNSLSSNLRQQCPQPSQVRVFIKPLVVNNTAHKCSVSANTINIPIIRLFMEYTTKEEPTKLAPTTRRPVPTTVKARPTTSN